MMYVPDTSQPGLSRTALGICAFCAMVNRHPPYRAAFYDPFAERLFAAAATDGPALLDAWRDWDSVLAFADAQAIARRLVVHVLWRKTFMQRRTLAAIASGARQIVVLGAGLDTLGLRLASTHAHVPVFEVDRPDTIAAKQALVRQNFGTPPNIRYTAVDFATQTTEDRLASQGFDPARPAVFIAEVSLEYVPPAEVAKVYAMIRATGQPGTRFLTTYADTAGSAAQHGESDALGASVSDAGEPFRFHVGPDQVAPYARSQDFDVLEHHHGAAQLCALLTEIGLSAADLPFDPALLDDSSFSLAALQIAAPN